MIPPALSDLIAPAFDNVIEFLDDNGYPQLAAAFRTEGPRLIDECFGMLVGKLIPIMLSADFTGLPDAY
jgi:hypothetical protein